MRAEATLSVKASGLAFLQNTHKFIPNFVHKHKLNFKSIRQF